MLKGPWLARLEAWGSLTLCEPERKAEKERENSRTHIDDRHTHFGQARPPVNSSTNVHAYLHTYTYIHMYVHTDKQIDLCKFGRRS